jgi:non-specific serine/threonine protein kinase
MRVEQSVIDLHITPHGNLRDEGGTFADGNGAGLLKLVRQKLPAEAGGALFFQKLFDDYIGRIAAAEPEDGNLALLFETLRPTEAENGFAVLSAPPVMGGEYLDGALLERFYREFEEAFQAAFFRYEGNLADFIRSLSPVWKDVGKVSFHLAENKADTSGECPFAFMASFIYRAEGGKAKHLPLGAALKAYAGDRSSMEAVLAPIQKAAQHSEIISGLLESRRIFQPSAWSGHEAYRFLRDIPHFEAANIVIRIANLWKTAPARAQVSVTLDTAKRSVFGADSLLQFSVEVTLGGVVLSAVELQELLDSGGGLVRLKGQWVEAEPEKIAALLDEWKQAEEVARREGLSVIDGLRLLAGADSTGGKLDASSELCRIEASGELKRLLSELHDPAGIAMPRPRAELRDILRPYQFEGLKYLWRISASGLGCCLADDMGLGKTLQVLSLIELWKNGGELKHLPVLLVLPATLLANWKSESAKFTPSLKLTVLHPSAMSKEDSSAFARNPEKYLAQFDLALITYGMLPRLPALSELEFPAVIADEAQAIKNPAAKQSKAVRGLHGKRRIALTGTPVENRLADLWSIFDFVNPGLLGNLKSFLEFTKKLNNDYSPLRKLTQPFILRRLKTDKRIISDLPDKTELKVYCNLSKRQAALYQHGVDEMRQALQKETESIKKRGIVLGYLMRFKQICNHPAQFLGNGDFAPELAGKFERIAELTESIASRQEKVLVFTQFREMTEPLRDHLQSCFGRDGLVLHGGTPVKERAALVKAFQDEDGPPFFVLSLKAAGTGLNLTAANHVIHFDRWWNPAVENQASDRAYRIGQKRNVLVHKFICKGTLEEKIDELIMDKQNLADELLSEGAEKLLTSMSDAELLDFVKLDINTMEI